jgi:hypothetical protein
MKSGESPYPVLDISGEAAQITRSGDVKENPITDLPEKRTQNSIKFLNLETPIHKVQSSQPILDQNFKKKTSFTLNCIILNWMYDFLRRN